MAVFSYVISHLLKLIQIDIWILLGCFVGSLARAYASYQRWRAMSYATNKGKKEMAVFSYVISHLLKLIQIDIWILLGCFVGSLAQAHASYQRWRVMS